MLAVSHDSKDVARRLWGCYSVVDHLEPRAFVADLLLYDRLVVPVPSTAADAAGCWDPKWDPDRQRRLLDILGDFARHEEWSAPLRAQFQAEWSPGDAALDITALGGSVPDAYAVTRRIVSEQLGKSVAADGDVLGVAVYAKPDRFDREWRLTATLPFLRKDREMRPGELREAVEAAPIEEQRLAKLVVSRLVVPDDGADDEEVLKRTVELVSRDDVAERRAEFHALIASLGAQGLKDETVVGEVEDLLGALNDAVRRHTKAQRARVAVQVMTTAEGAAGLWAPPAALAAGPTAALGEAMIQRRWGAAPTAAELQAVSLLADAGHALN